MFNYKTKPASRLSGQYIHAQSRYFDFFNDEDEYLDRWRHYSATRCEECGTVLVGSGGESWHYDEDSDSDCDGYVSFDDPVMNYIWPISTRLVGNRYDAVAALVDLPLCLVTIENEDGDEDEFLALTGGGMDLSWEIIEAYMRLGYLPPLALIAPPAMAGKTLTRKNRWLLSGCAASIRSERNSLHWRARDIRSLRVTLAKESARQNELRRSK